MSVRIVKLDTYDPIETDVLTAYVQTLDIRQADRGDLYHVWAITALGNEFRVTQDGYSTREAAVAHAVRLAMGMRAHLEACFADGCTVEYRLDRVLN